MSENKIEAPRQFANAKVGGYVKFVSEPKTNKSGEEFKRLRLVTGKGDDAVWKTIQVAADTDIAKGDYLEAEGELSVLDKEIYVFALGDRGSVTRIVFGEDIIDSREEGGGDDAGAGADAPAAAVPAARGARPAPAAAPATRTARRG